MQAHHYTRRTNIFYLESEALNPSGFDCIIKDLTLSSEIKPKTSLLNYYIKARFFLLVDLREFFFQI